MKSAGGSNRADYKLDIKPAEASAGERADRAQASRWPPIMPAGFRQILTADSYVFANRAPSRRESIA